MRIFCLLISVSLIAFLLIIPGCALAPEEVEVPAKEGQPVELTEEEFDEEEKHKGVPDGFPVYPGAEYSRQYEFAGSTRYIYQIDASARDLYSFYVEELQGNDVVIDGECADDYGWADMVVYKNDEIQIVIKIGSYPDFGMEIHKDIYHVQDPYWNK